MSADCCWLNLAIICLFRGPPQTTLVTSNFLRGPSGIRKISSLQSLVCTVSFLKAKKVVTWRFYIIYESLDTHTHTGTQLCNLIWLLTRITTMDFRQWKGARGYSDVILQQPPLPDNKSMTDPRPRRGLCIRDLQNIQNASISWGSWAGGALSCFHLPQSPVMVFGGKGRWQLRSVTFKMDSLDRKEFPFFFWLGRKWLCVYNL